jgi:ferric-dicitrate binding protein FerR (iron transport regulator)
VIFPWQKIAAALLIIVGAGVILLRITKPSAASYVTITNSSGQIKELSLPDGSQIWLNAETELRYKTAFTKSREIELNGEAYFEVVHDPTHPFLVKAGELQTTVLGTSFNIKAYKQETQAAVSLISGSVQVSNNSKTPISLKPSTQLVYSKNNQETGIAVIDTNSVMAWKKGKLQFEGESLATIASSLERWYAVKFVFTTPSMKNCRYYMSFDNKLSLEKTLAIVAELTGMKYSVANNTVTLSGNGCQ